MKATVTAVFATCLLVGLVTTATAQQDRNGDDVIWARDVGGATLTLDGQLTEPEWQEAESIHLQWNTDLGLPGSGQKIEGNPLPEAPTDPADGIFRVLRDGNTLWVSLEATDKSVGGGVSLWNLDGIIMSVLDRSQFPDDPSQNVGFSANGVLNAEFIYSWWNPADTTNSTQTYANGQVIGSGRPVPEMEARLFGDYGVPFASGNIERSPEDVAVWDARATVDGFANDDTHGEDAGYVLEMRIDMAALGYDFTSAGGDMVPFNIALEDQDYAWPSNPDLTFLSRVWWQNQWANNFHEGVAYIAGSPGVTVASGALTPLTDAEFTVASGALFDSPTVDGALDDPQWERITPLFQIQYQAPEAVRMENPGSLARWHHSWFRPDINGDGNAALVVDPSLGMFKMFFQDTKLYVGLDTDDQAISGLPAENGRDGFRITIHDVDSVQTDGTLHSRQFDFLIDSTGAIAYANDAATNAQSGAVIAAVWLKGNSTAADPSDIDTGYQIEAEIDLVEALGYPSDLGDHRIWISLNYFDGDFLQSQGDSYATRTWISGERGDGASIYGYLDSSLEIGTAAEDVAELPKSIELDGNYPNPFNPSTTLRYALPHSGDVTIHVFDAIGRKVASVEPGTQTAGRHELLFNANELASGVYFYRVRLTDAAGADLVSTMGRMILVK